MSDGNIFNMRFEDDKEISREEVIDPCDAWFGDGLHLKYYEESINQENQ